MDELVKIGFSAVEVERTYLIPAGTLGNMRYQGVGPKYYRLGRRILYLREDIEAYIRREPILTKDSIELSR